MIGRLLRSVDFERVLRTRSRASSTHFAVHHLADVPGTTVPRPAKAVGHTELSTVVPAPAAGAVDDTARPAPCGVWLGAVVPKRHARRSVTRSLLKRQIRGVVASRSGDLAAGLWVVRLRAPFDRKLFPSAASEALRRLAHAELDQVLVQAAAPRAGP